MPILRIYWYDAMRIGRPTPEQAILADSDDIKIRLGQINSAGEQKGVDALIITDMVELARNHAMTDAILMSGDEDVRVGVVLAQQFGVRVHLIGIHPARSNQSRSLRQEADTNVEWQLSDIGNFLSHNPVSDRTLGGASTAATGLDVLITQMIDQMEANEIASLKAGLISNSLIPAEYDKKILRIGRAHYGQQTLTPPERETLRTAFKRLIGAG